MDLANLQLDARLAKYLQHRTTRLVAGLARALEARFPFEETPYGFALHKSERSYAHHLKKALQSYYASRFGEVNQLLRSPRSLQEQMRAEYLSLSKHFNPSDPSDPYFMSDDDMQAGSKARADRYTMSVLALARILVLMLSMAPKTPQQVTLYRGLGIADADADDFVNTFQPGAMVTMGQLLSTTGSVQLARSFFTKYKYTRSLQLSVLLVLDVPAGAPLWIRSATMAGEAEVLLPSCTVWEVDRLAMESKKVLRVYMRLVSTGAANFGNGSRPTPALLHMQGEEDIVRLKRYFDAYMFDYVGGFIPAPKFGDGVREAADRTIKANMEAFVQGFKAAVGRVHRSTPTHTWCLAGCSAGLTDSVESYSVFPLPSDPVSA
jgi:hypothetical protein